MKYHRYGIFKAENYKEAIGGIVCLLFLGVMIIALKESLWYIIMPILLAVSCISIIVKRHTEYFEIIDNQIISYNTMIKKRKIDIPEHILVIISYADLPMPLTRRSSFGGVIRPLKKQYSIIILYKLSIAQALERLHKHSKGIYTNTLIREIFEDYHYVYDCIYSDEILKDILLNREYELIVPESLKCKIPSVLKYKVTMIDKDY